MVEPHELVSLQALAFFSHLSILGGIVDLVLAAIILIVGILVIILIVGALIVFLPAIIVAVVVWFFTGSLLVAGIAFLVVAIISIAAK
jgi:hypothetical protein